MMNKTNLPKVWNTYGYTRVSKDDRDKDESNSIKTQRDLILYFAEQNPDINIVSIVADDGKTGANFNRDAFTDMIANIENGTVNCVVVKDFSRLGRDHIEMGKYIERYFAQKNVRFISINDNYDSFHADMTDTTNSLMVPFKNIINEAFLEDISIKTKSQLAIKRKNGEFVGNYAVFGYSKTADKKLVADDYAATIVRTIFEYKLLGYNEQQIADMSLSSILIMLASQPSAICRALSSRWCVSMASAIIRAVPSQSSGVLPSSIVRIRTRTKHDRSSVRLIASAKFC